jgi:hypothetical protein
MIIVGDLPIVLSEFEDEERPSLSHDVVVASLADAALGGGRGDLHLVWKGFLSRCAKCTRAGSAMVAWPDLDIHAWLGHRHPELAEVEEPSDNARPLSSASNSVLSRCTWTR